MSGLETAIRTALSRADRGDATARARIYQSARQALEAGLVKQEITDPQVIEAQRVRLEHKIREIEFEERESLREEARLAREAASAPAVMSSRQNPPPDAGADDVLPDASPMSAQRGAPALGIARGHEPDLGGQTRSAGAGFSQPAPVANAIAADSGGLDDLSARRDVSAGPASHSDVSTDELAAPLRVEAGAGRMAPVEPMPGPRGKQSRKAAKLAKLAKARQAELSADDAPGIPGEKRPRKRRGFLSRLFISVTFFAFCAMGLWWAYSGGLFLTAAERDTSVPNPPASVAEEDFTGQPASPAFDPQQGFSDDWLEVYTAGGKAQASAGKDASVETVAMADGPALRIASRSPQASGDVAIPVPVELLRQLGGKTSTLALTLQSAGDNGVQLAVQCDFSSLGTCSRHRVMALQEKSDTLFRITFDRTLAPNQPGRILINSDILGSRQPVLLYSVRILPGQ